jgi:hypothetical protein
MWVLVTVLAVLVLVLYRHFGLISLGTLEGVQRDGLTVGVKAPPLAVTAPDGRQVDWAPTGQHTLLIFGSPNCKPCAEVLPDLQVLHRDHPELDVTFVTSGTEHEARQMAAKFHLSLPCYADTRELARDAYRVRVSPFGFVIGEDQTILAKGLASDIHRIHDLLEAGGLRITQPRSDEWALSAGIKARSVSSTTSDADAPRVPQS